MSDGPTLWPALFAATGIALPLTLTALYALALIKGDPTDRACAHIMAVALILDTLLWTVSGSADQAGVNALVLAALVTIALRRPRRYPLFVAAAQLLVTIVYALDAVGLIKLAQTTALLGGSASLLVFGSCCAGLLNHLHNQRSDSAR